MEDNETIRPDLQDRFEKASQAFEDRYKPSGLIKKLMDAQVGRSGDEETPDTVSKPEFSDVKFHTYPIV